MKCPVCDQKNSSMRCSRCGFDASMDYGCYPTLAPLQPVPSVSVLRRQWQIPQQEQREQLEALMAVLLAIQYRKIIRSSPELRNANRRIQQLEKAELAERSARTSLASQLIHIQNEFDRNNLEHSQQIQQLEQKLRTQSKSLLESAQNLKWLNNDLQTLERSHKTILAEKNELEAALKAATVRNAELEAALKAERNKGVISRIFNR